MDGLARSYAIVFYDILDLVVSDNCEGCKINDPSQKK